MLATVVGRYDIKLIFFPIWELLIENPDFNETVSLMKISCFSKEVASELMVYSYKHGFSGFAAKLTEAQAQQLAGTC